MVTRGVPLLIDAFSMSIGEMSVGLPTACSVDTVLVTYLELIRQMRPERPSEIRQDDLEALALRTGLSVELVKNHLARLMVGATR